MSDSWAIRRLVSHIKEEWRRGESPDAEAALAAHPQLRRWKSIVLDLACEEYQLRAGEGQDLGPGEFCERFPEHQRSLLHRIEVEQYLRGQEDQRAVRWPEEGDEFLGYRLLEQLGKGAVGRVFLAQQIEMRDRLVVVKITPRGQREAHTLALLNHPHIVPVYRCDEDAATGLAAICMPYMGRVTMEDLLVAAEDGVERDFPALLAELARRFSSDDTPHSAGEHRPRSSRLEGMLEIGRQIAEALAHTHERGILHLDLKPSNVLLLADGRPMLLDFNLSVDGSLGASVIGGTLPYMSPEQLQEAVLGRSYSSRPVDGRSDVFSLGVMLYEMISGRHPFGEIRRTRDPREAAKELLRRHERGPAPWPPGAPAERELVRFLDGCLAFHPAQRPQSAAEAAAALQRFLGPRYGVRRWAKRRRKSIAAAGAVVLGVCLALGAAAAVAPPESQRRLNEAQAHLAREEWKLAEAALKKSLVADDRSSLAWELLGRAQQQQGKHREAFSSFEKAYALCGEPRFLELLGDARLAEEEYDAAIGWYQQALAQSHVSPDILRKLGESQRNRNSYDSARSNLDQALELAPTSADARRSRIQTVVNQSLVSDEGIDASALENASGILRNADSSGQELFEAAIIFARTGAVDKYETQLKECLERAREAKVSAQKLRAPVFEPFFQKSWFQALIAE
jgi:serine/threonine protein kinase/Tfp pilus assembly protein PilF